jgi:hypothetical protein
VLLAVAFSFRAVDLGRVPGINGDEAWYGIQVQAMLRGHDWGLRTPSRLPLNPFFFAPLIAFHAAFPEPWFLVLRLPSLVSGLFLIGLTFFLVRRAAGTQAVWLATLFAAALPIHIAYSRFGWDASQSPLAGLIVLYFALVGRFRLTLIAWAAAWVVHPTNVFLGPILVGILAGTWWEKNRTIRGIGRWLPWVLVLISSLGVVLGVLFYAGLVPPLARLPSSGQVVSRLTSPAEWLEFAVRYADLISGVTIYRLMIGALEGHVVRLHELLFWLGVIVVVSWGGVQLYRRKQGRFLGLVGGCGASLVGLYLIAGLKPLTPGNERYAMFLTVPSCIGAALLLAALAPTPQAERWQRLGGLAVAGLLLAGFWQFYWEPLQTTGGEALSTAEGHDDSFRTGPVEPKLAALQQILRVSPPGMRIKIWAENWWSFAPIRYLAANYPEAHLIVVDGNGQLPHPKNQSFRGKPVLFFLVSFTEGNYARELDGQTPRPGQPSVVGSWDIPDAAGRPVLRVWQLAGE